MAFKWPQRAMMRTLDYSIKADRHLTNEIVKHDPRMISYVENYTSDLIIPLLTKNSLIFRYIDFSKAASDNDLLQILEYSYSINKRTRKEVMNMFSYHYQESADFKDNKRHFKNVSVVFKPLIKKILSENPEYFMIIEKRLLLKLFDYLGEDPSKFVESISFKNVAKKFIKLYERYKSEEDNFYDPITSSEETRLFGYYYSVFVHRVRSFSEYGDNFVEIANLLNKTEELKDMLLIFKI
jgi:hypothetical protein